MFEKLHTHFTINNIFFGELILWKHCTYNKLKDVYKTSKQTQCDTKLDVVRSYMDLINMFL